MSPVSRTPTPQATIWLEGGRVSFGSMKIQYV